MSTRSGATRSIAPAVGVILPGSDSSFGGSGRNCSPLLSQSMIVFPVAVVIGFGSPLKSPVRSLMPWHSAVVDEVENNCKLVFGAVALF